MEPNSELKQSIPSVSTVGRPAALTWVFCFDHSKGGNVLVAYDAESP